MKLAVIFGGKSSEHDISIITGVMAVNAAGVKHEVIPVYITRDGHMVTGKHFDNTETFLAPVKGKSVCFIPGSGGIKVGGKFVHIDCAINACHGHGGEDGALSGLLELSEIPYAGSGVAASAVGMDKLIFKQLLSGNGMPVLPYFGVNRYDYSKADFDLAAQADKIGFPLIVKPCNLGSSIGVSIAENYRELFVALDAAFLWDRRAIVEKALVNFTEVNCAVLGYDDIIVSSEVEQPVGFKDILKFDDKYCRSLKTEVRKMPADLPDDVRYKVRSLAERTFKEVGASGVARVDFLLGGGEIYVNEINTVPGSLSEYLFGYSGMTFVELIDKLIGDAIKIKSHKDVLKYRYKSNVLLDKKIHK